MTDHTVRTDPDLSGQVAVVTGGGRGIGRACALALAAAGAAVAVAARTARELAETVWLYLFENLRLSVEYKTAVVFG